MHACMRTPGDFLVLDGALCPTSTRACLHACLWRGPFPASAPPLRARARRGRTPVALALTGGVRARLRGGRVHTRGATARGLSGEVKLPRPALSVPTNVCARGEVRSGGRAWARPCAHCWVGRRPRGEGSALLFRAAPSAIRQPLTLPFAVAAGRRSRQAHLACGVCVYARSSAAAYSVHGRSVRGRLRLPGPFDQAPCCSNFRFVELKIWPAIFTCAVF